MLRISATIPDDLIAAADGRAAALDRSRSWVLSEALRQYLLDPAYAEVAARPLVVREGSRPGLGESRLGQLEADLRLTPEERVKEAERTLRATEYGRPPRQPVIVFDSFDDYLEWDRRESRW